MLDEPTSGLDPESAEPCASSSSPCAAKDGRCCCAPTTSMRSNAWPTVWQCFDRDSWQWAHRVHSGNSCSLRAFGFSLTEAAEPFAAILRAGWRPRRASADGIWLSLAGGTLTTPQIVRTLVEAGAGIETVERDEPSLEDVYIKLLRSEGDIKLLRSEGDIKLLRSEGDIKLLRSEGDIKRLHTGDAS